MECAAAAPPPSLQGSIHGVFRKKQPIAAAIPAGGGVSSYKDGNMLSSEQRILRRTILS